MEREPEQAALAAEVHEAPHIEEHRPPPGRDAEHSTTLLDDVDRARIAGRVRDEHRRLERPGDERPPERALRALPRVTAGRGSSEDGQRAGEHEGRQDAHEPQGTRSAVPRERPEYASRS